MVIIVEKINFLIKDVHDYALFMSLLGSFFVNTNSYSKSLLLKFSKAREKYLLHFTFWFSKLFFHLPCRCFLKFKNIQKTKHNIFHSLKGFLLPKKPSCHLAKKTSVMSGMGMIHCHSFWNKTLLVLFESFIFYEIHTELNDKF